jgi:hypothetical protein
VYYGARFDNDALLLAFPDKAKKKRGQPFLKCVVEHFAKSIAADLLTLSLDDIKDLAQGWVPRESRNKRTYFCKEDRFMDMYFERYSSSVR